MESLKRPKWGFAALALWIVAQSLASFWVASIFEDSNRWVSHTLQVQLQIERIQSLMFRAQSDFRAYAITGMPEYRDDHETSVKEVTPLIEDLRTLTRDNPRQQANVAQLAAMNEEKRARWLFAAKLIEAGDMYSVQQMFTDKSATELNSKLKPLLSSMQQEEQSLLSHRIEKAQRFETALKILSLVGNIFALLIAIAAGWIPLRRSSERRESELKKAA